MPTVPGMMGKNPVKAIVETKTAKVFLCSDILQIEMLVFYEVIYAGNYRQNGNEPEKEMRAEPEIIHEGAGQLKVVIQDVIDERRDYRDHLPGRFVLADGVGAQDRSPAQSRHPKPRDDEVPANDGNDHPGRHHMVDVIESRETDEDGADQDLVRQRIHQFAEISHKPVFPGDVAVQPVGDGSQGEKAERDGLGIREDYEQAGHDGDRHGEPCQGKLVGKIHTSPSRTAVPVTS